MERYIPPKKGKTAGVFSFCLLVVAFGCFLLSSFFSPVWLYQLLAVLCLLAFIQIITKFLLSEVSYLLRDGCLLVFQKQGKKEKEVGNIRLKEGVFLFRRAEFEKRKKEFLPAQRFSYTANLFTKDAAILIFEDSGRKFILEFEPDEAFSRLIAEEIKKA